MHDQPALQGGPAEGASRSEDKVRQLYRQQAIDFHRTKQYGTVLLASPLSHRVLTGVGVAIGAGLLAFLALFSTTRKAHCQGVLRPDIGVLGIQSGKGGLIAEQRVREGQQVRQGDVMFVLTSERTTGAVGSTESVVTKLLQSRHESYAQELAQSAQSLQRRLALANQRNADLQTEAARLGDQVTLQQQRVTLAEQAYSRYRDLHATSYISAAQLQDKQAELIDQRQRLGDLQRLHLGKQREIAAAQAELLELREMEEREARGLQRNMASLEQDLAENEARREIIVRAPQDGVVTAIAANPGQTVGANAVLASLLPSGARLEAEIYAPSRSVGFVKPGMPVLLRYQAYPYQKFGQHAATVLDVTHTSVPPEELPSGIAAAGRGEPMYRIRLKLERQAVTAYGKEVSLKSGMLLDASIMLEKRRLYEWVLEPLFSISGRV
ncbi:HlyD family efflux transporter periplasmic adaptor subunit [Pseudoduganella ginsengisoli]|uniref:HlyD family efflux transporter periplasmic adaptor subunit n=1 Tax=Pseudoduganella ginsengisoli TaxID=1462440 RepID=A0A6L6Q1C1_9BURK|nr:HlyD family efflux transporter periplasmic adaptor subunit [Pseudoduganella ginsengisoli]MTW03643.1 HlyD family efflux transporter periplasmic adaptor subunit [Pseudoduganella ginsengisoli]